MHLKQAFWDWKEHNYCGRRKGLFYFFFQRLNFSHILNASFACLCLSNINLTKKLYSLIIFMCIYRGTLKFNILTKCIRAEFLFLQKKSFLFIWYSSRLLSVHLGKDFDVKCGKELLRRQKIVCHDKLDYLWALSAKLYRCEQFGTEMWNKELKSIPKGFTAREEVTCHLDVYHISARLSSQSSNSFPIIHHILKNWIFIEANHVGHCFQHWKSRWTKQLDQVLHAHILMGWRDWH